MRDDRGDDLFSFGSENFGMGGERVFNCLLDFGVSRG